MMSFKFHFIFLAAIVLASGKAFSDPELQHEWQLNSKIVHQDKQYKLASIFDPSTGNNSIDVEVEFANFNMNIGKCNRRGCWLNGEVITDEDLPHEAQRLLKHFVSYGRFLTIRTYSKENQQTLLSNFILKKYPKALLKGSQTN